MSCFEQQFVTSFLKGTGYNETRVTKGGEGMVIYLDVLFVLNAVIDYLLLLVSARVAGTPLHRGRFAIGAVLGGLYAAALFLPGFSFLNRKFYRFLSAFFMLLVAYGATRFLLKQTLVFLALVCVLGGSVMAIGMMDGTTMNVGRGVVYSIPDVKTILLASAVCYAVLTAAGSKLFRHTVSGGELRQITFELEKRKVQLTALIDTGNTLSDPMTGRAVPVAEGDALGTLFPVDHCPRKEDLLDPIQGIARLNTGQWRGRFRLLPYRAVGVEHGFLLAVKMDSVFVGTQRLNGTLVALSPTPVSDGGGYRVLTGGE